MPGSWNRSRIRYTRWGGSRRATFRRTWSAWRVFSSLSRQQSRLARLESAALQSQVTWIANRRGILASQVLDALGDDPAAIVPEIAALLLQDAHTTAGQLLAWPTGKGQGVKKMARLRELKQSAHLEDRLAAALYEREKRKPQ